MLSKAKNYLLVLLAAATVSFGYLAWQQTQRLTALQEELRKPAPARAARYVRPAPTEESLPGPATKTDAVASMEAPSRPEVVTQPARQRGTNRIRIRPGGQEGVILKRSLNRFKGAPDSGKKRQTISES